MKLSVFKEYQLHRERLQRHYNSAVQNYDLITLRDLSNALRIWMDLKFEISKPFPDFATEKIFQSANPSKSIGKILKRSTSLVAYFPGGAITRAYENKISGSTITIHDQIFYTIAEVLFKNTPLRSFGELQINRVLFLANLPSQKDSSKLTSKVEIKKLSYSEWLGAEAVRFYEQKKGRNSPFIITREQLVRGVANNMDGSHPSVAPFMREKSKAALETEYLLEKLNQFYCGNLHLPYFIVLKTAQDILENTRFLK